MESFFENDFYFKEKFQDKYKERKYEKNDVISYRIGKEVSNKLFIVSSGVILVETQLDQNITPFYSFVGQNNIFGWEDMDTNNAVVVTVTAQETTSIVEVDREFFFDHVYINPDLSRRFLKKIRQEFYLLVESYQYVNKPPKVKLLNSLLNLSTKLDLKQNESGELELPKYITPTFISKYVRSSEPNISKAGTYLERKKIIKRNPYRIIDQERARVLLQEWSGGEARSFEKEKLK
ncbi:MAG: Crp/Fnr family transcriptional regulator [Carnobacterium sp.]|uniref:Crp/Fnr family transcriptional regulator n=1 Tax=Carnobacterium sp. TaxID=48221 RepID=UPI00257B0C72|nr:Crp/Fnr family transcriptional regulator [Carnobacterium sp.]MBQ6485182.1 Crp/Fnr family transcriptional regulator [Carnobacterium sp.]